MSVFDTKDETAMYSAEEIQKNKVACVFAYFGILFFIPLLAAPESGYAKFHANQGLLLFITAGCLSVLGSVLGAGSVVPLIGFAFTVSAGVVGAIGGLATFILFILGIVNVINGNARELPIIGKFRIIK